MTSPTQRSLANLRANGYTACVVEKWIPQIKQRKDAFGFADLIAVKIGSPGTLYVQTTTAEHMADRIAKIKAIAAAGILLENMGHGCSVARNHLRNTNA